ncbi:MAG: hypothetical protein VXX72_06850 [Pseudomonadota bacterium]|nr:hypothetical protein [Pseudomonadota bacterium]
MISRNRHNSGARRWLCGTLLLAFLCQQSVAISHDHNHDHDPRFKYAFAEHLHPESVDAGKACGPSTAPAHSPATGFIDTVFATHGLAGIAKSAVFSSPWTNVDEHNYPRAPPTNQLTI